MQLNEDQRRAVQTALEVAECAGHMSLMGPAGTGKTTTIRAITKAVVDRWRRKKVLLLAPTHKARRQFEAAELPSKVQAETMQRFCKVSQSNWRDEDRFSCASDKDLAKVQEVRSKYSLVIVDESSMAPHDLAAKVLDICNEAGVGVVFSGDSFQLPPVDESTKAEEDASGPDFEKFESRMAPEFLDAPVKVELSRVMRHGGPILEYATKLRDQWDELQTFPISSRATEESEIRVVKDPVNAFLDHFLRTFRGLQLDGFNASEFYRQAPRALCYMNSTVRCVTDQLRIGIYGEQARKQWRTGELIMFPGYTRTLTTPIQSSTDAIVVRSEIVSVEEKGSTVHWKTPGKGLPRECELNFSAQLQRLHVYLLRPDGSVDQSKEYVVTSPLLDDDSPRETYAELKARIKAVSPKLESDHEAWAWLKAIKDAYLAKITSAFVMTVHKSQGSTFEHVYVGRDLLYREDRETRNPLLYVAASRASKTLTFGLTNG